METDIKLLEVFMLLKKYGLQSFYTGFVQQLQVKTTGDFLNVSCRNLQHIGIVSRAVVRTFEIIVESLKTDTIGKFDYSNDKILEEFIIETSLMSKDAVIITAADVVVQQRVGEGNFGNVFKGIWKKKNIKKETIIPIALKTLSDGSEMSWKKEVAIFTALNHNHGNIVKFFGLLIGEKDEVKMITEFACFGSLLDRLTERSISSIALLCQFSVQISSGMIYLHTNNLVHRDLSTRNILVTAKNQVKISDFGLSKILDDEEKEWVMDGKEMLPIRWLAPESYNNGVFTTASDVWSFGVVLWEMFTFGDVPWRDLTIEQVKSKISFGEMLHEPQVCPVGYYDVMKMCFSFEANCRPSFHVIYEELILIQPDLLEMGTSSTNQYDLCVKKGDLVTAIRPINSSTESNSWLGQHEQTLLFGRFDATSATTIQYTIAYDNQQEETNDAILYHNASPTETFDERNETKESPSCCLETLSSLPSKETSLCKSVSSACSIDQQQKEEYIVARQNFFKNTKENENIFPSSKLTFKETNLVTQETVNDRISQNWDAFLSENKNLVTTSVEIKNLLRPIDVSKKPTLSSVISSIDPYAKGKSMSQEHIDKQSINHTRCQLNSARSAGDLTARFNSFNLPRPQPDTQINNVNKFSCHSVPLNSSCIKNKVRHMHSDRTGIQETEVQFEKFSVGVNGYDNRDDFNNRWHSFENSVKESKKTVVNNGEQIRSSSDASAMSQKQKESFSIAFQIIRKTVPKASISECLDALRFSNNNTKKAVQYIQVRMLTQLNLGFSFEDCKTVFNKNNNHYENSATHLKTDYLCSKFRDVRRARIVKILERSLCDINAASVVLFYDTCQTIGVEKKRAKSLLIENKNDPFKALEICKILRLAEITNQAEFSCFRTLAHCQWQLDRAVDYFLSNAI